MFIIMEVNRAFRLKRKPRPTSKIPSASLGAAHVEIFENIARSKAWRKMAAHVAHFQARTLAGEAL
jgi:hypothetical protein